MDNCWHDTYRVIPNMDYWWNDTDRERQRMELWWKDSERIRPKYSERITSQCHFVHHKTQIPHTLL